MYCHIADKVYHCCILLIFGKPKASASRGKLGAGFWFVYINPYRSVGATSAVDILGANQPNATIRLVRVDRLVVSEEEKTVNFRVFLSESERTSFKIACAKNRTTMSQQALELIRQWLKTQENETPSLDKKGEGE